MPMEFNDVLPPGVEAFDDESWQTNEKYVINKAQNNEKTEKPENQVPAKVASNDTPNDMKHENDDDESKNSKDKKVNKDKKRRKEKDVHSKKSKKHKREKSERDASQEKSKAEIAERHGPNTESSESDMKLKSLTETIKTNEIDRTLTPPLSTITKSDSVLDLYDNIDLDIFGDQSINQSDDFLTLPEPSKWELDDKPSVSDTTESKRRSSVSHDHPSTKELKAEKPHSKDSSPLLSAIVRPSLESSSATVHNLKISVPAKSTNHSERSIELKSSVKHDKIKSVVSKDSKDSKKPSIKDRLGEKVKEKSSDRKPTDHGRSSSGKLASALRFVFKF